MKLNDLEARFDEIKKISNLIFNNCDGTIRITGSTIIIEQSRMKFILENRKSPEQKQQVRIGYSTGSRIDMDDIEPDLWFNQSVQNDINIDYQTITEICSVLKNSGHELSIRIIKEPDYFDFGSDEEGDMCEGSGS